jgi:hypothetical protein
MNERIEELSKQAWEYADKYSRDGDGKHGGLYNYKFAELLIHECTKVASDIVVMEEGTDFGLTQACCEHFGIGEPPITEFSFTP